MRKTYDRLQQELKGRPPPHRPEDMAPREDGYGEGGWGDRGGRFGGGGGYRGRGGGRGRGRGRW